MASAPKSTSFRFSLAGLVNKADPELLGDGQYRGLMNMDSSQEGTLWTRTGRRRIGQMSGAFEAIKIQKLVVNPGVENPDIPTSNPRYILGPANPTFSEDLWRTLDYTSFTKVVTGLDSTSSPTPSAFSLASYASGGTGAPWAFIAGDAKMVKDRGLAFQAGGPTPYATLPLWGILPAFGVAMSDVAGAGFLDGGATNSPNQSTPYDYRYTYVGIDTNNEGNPSLTQLDDSTAGTARADTTLTGTPIAVHLQSVTVTVWGTDDPQVQQIKIYRRGGLLFDTWRLVGIVSNPGIGVSTTFTDNIGDVDLVNAPLIVLDNDPPVSSTVPTPITAAVTAPITEGFQTVTVTPAQLGRVRPGTLLHFFYDAPEDVVVQSSTSSTFTAYFQHAHASGADIEVDTITGQPAPIAITYQQFVLVAGDPNNRHIIYRSKGDTPESFPVVSDDGTIATIAAGSPSNPIIAMCEFRGQILTLNANSLFETVIINGSLIQPAEVANRGVVNSYAWCKKESEVWFVSTDGVWSWDGGLLTKRSEAIDPLFHGQMYNRIQPVGVVIGLTCNRGDVYLVYNDSSPDRNRRVLKCSPRYGDRWTQLNFDIVVSSVEQPATVLFNEEDTGSMVLSREDPGGPVFCMADKVVVNTGTFLNYTNDEYTTDPTTQGTPISFDIYLPWFDMGAPGAVKAFEEILLEVFNELGTLKVDTYLDYDEFTVVDTQTIPLQNASWVLVNLLPNLVNRSDPTVSLQSFGREARAISFRIYGQTLYRQVAFRTLSFQFQDVGAVTAGVCRDWDNLGHKYDKKLYQMAVEFDTGGIDQTLVMDTMIGVQGSALALDSQFFVLSNPVIVGSGRARKSFPINDGTIVKLVRLRAVATIDSKVAPAARWKTFRVLDVQFEKEDYPPDITSFTAWDNGGSENLKYANQIDLQVNTNNIPVTFSIQADGVTVGPPITVQSTERDRARLITLQTGLIGKNWRIFVDPNQIAISSGGGCFQLFALKWVLEPADRGAVAHTQDWQDLGHPWDKRLQVLNVEWDNTGGADVQLRMDLLSGVNGGNFSPVVALFDLGTGTGRSQRAFPLQDGLIAKKVRVYPSAALPAGFRSWSYACEFEKWPPDIIFFTEPKDFGHPYDKEGQVVVIQIDTGNTPCRVQVVVDGNPAGAPFMITTTIDDWRRELPLPQGIIGRLWKLTFMPAGDAAAKSQLFSWDLQHEKYPAYLIGFTERENGGNEYLKYANQLDLEINTNNIPVQFTVQADGVNIGAAITVQSTYRDRQRNFTLAPGITGKKWNIAVDLTQAAIVIGGGWFQLFSHRFVFEPADRGDVRHSFDWDSLNHNWDKQLRSVTIEWDLTSQSPVTVQLDTISGLSGNAVTSNVAQFVLSGGRSKAQFSLPPDVVAKMIRLYPIGAPTTAFKQWGYVFDKTDDPQDVVQWTPWNDFGWPFEKIGRNLILDVDTGGVPALVDIQADGVTVQTVTVTSTYTDRHRVISLNRDLEGSLWRLVVHPGTNGLFKLFGWQLDYIKEPAAVTQWASYQQAFGYFGWKAIKQFWIEYVCNSEIHVVITSDTGSTTLIFPPHATRSVERAYLPDDWGPGYNKSTMYDFEITSTTSDKFKLYADASGLELIIFAQDRRSAYQRFTLSQFLQIPIGTSG